MHKRKVKKENETTKSSNYIFTETTQTCLERLNATWPIKYELLISYENMREVALWFHWNIF